MIREQLEQRYFELEQTIEEQKSINDPFSKSTIVALKKKQTNIIIQLGYKPE